MDIFQNSVRGAGQVEIRPQAVPTDLAAVTGCDAWLIGVVVENPTAAAITFTLQDGQATPVEMAKTCEVAANSFWVMNVPFGYWCPQGFAVQASDAGLNFYATWRQ